eukprot:5582053-Amphidinium_carterae.1
MAGARHAVTGISACIDLGTLSTLDAKRPNRTPLAYLTCPTGRSCGHGGFSGSSRHESCA